MQNSANRVNMLQLYYQDCDIVIGLHNDEAPFVRVTQRYVPEEIVLWYNKEND